MKRISPLRFFLALKVHSTSGLAVLVLVTAVSIWTVRLSPSELDTGLGMVLLVQIFLASSGFMPAARRGHFDPVLVGRSRVRVATSHWLVSVAPGIAAWVAIAGTAYMLGNSVALSAIVGRRLAALCIVSSIAWAAGFWFTRSAAGVAWLGGLAVVLVRHVALMPAGNIVSAATVLREAGALVVCPFLLLGPGPVIAPASITLAIAGSMVSLVMVWGWTRRVDVSLRNDR